MSNSSNSRDEEINKAILEWLIKKKYTNVIEPFIEASGLTSDKASKDNLLERKWGAILVLNKKIMDLDNENKQLKEELNTRGLPNSKKDNDSIGLPKSIAKSTLKGHRGTISTLVFHPLYNVLVTGSEDAKIISWECNDFTIEKELKGHTSAINALAFDSNGKQLASCSNDLSIKIWNFENYTCIRTLSGHEHTVSSIEFSNNENFLFSASRDKTIKMWEVSSGNLKKTFEGGHSDWVRSISVNSTGNLLASGSDDQSIIVWNVETMVQQYFLNGHENRIEYLVFVNNPKSINTIFNSDYVENFTKELRADKDTANEGENKDTNEDKNLQNLAELNKKLMEKTKLNNQKINKEYVISCGRDKFIKIWDVFGQNCIYTLNGHDNWVRSICLHPNGLYLFSVSDDKSLRIWDLKTGRCHKKFQEAHEKFIMCVSMSYQFPLLATGSIDQTIKIWDCK